MAVLAALLAGVVALTGFLVNGSLARASEKRKACAEALACVQRYIQLPYMFRRRVDDEKDTLRELGRVLADTQVSLAFHQRWLQLEDDVMAEHYRALVEKVRQTNSNYRRDALSREPTGLPEDVEVGHPYLADVEAEWERCIGAMRSHINRTRLKFWTA